MKFIGQYIQDFIARFRSDVYLEDVNTGTIASGANLGLDSNNKIVKNTVGGGGTTDLTSDVTGVLPIANGGTNANTAAGARTSLGVDPSGTDNSTNVTLAGEDYLSLSGQEITANDIDLTDNVTGTLPISSGGTGATSAGAARTALGVDSSGTDNSTNVTLAGSLDYITISGQEITRNAIALADDVSGFLPVANGGTGANNVAGARASLGVDAAGTDNSTDVTLAGTPDYITISGQQITRNQIDLTADVTGALPRANLATQNAYQYISFTGNVTANTTGNGYWEYPSANGISNHLWTQIVKNTTGGVNNRDTTTVGDEVGIDRLNQGSAGVRIPYAGTIVGFTGSGRNASGNRVYYAGLFVGTPDWGTNNDINAELVAVATADNNSGNYLSRPSKLEDLSRSYSIAAGDVIYPAFKGSGTNADIIQANITIVIKTPLV